MFPVIGLAVDDVTSLTGLKFGKSGEVVVGFVVVVGRVVSVVRCIVVGLVVVDVGFVVAVVVVVVVVIMVDFVVGKVVDEVVEGLAVVVEVVVVVTMSDVGGLPGHSCLATCCAVPSSTYANWCSKATAFHPGGVSMCGIISLQSNSYM